HHRPDGSSRRRHRRVFDGGNAEPERFGWRLISAGSTSAPSGGAVAMTDQGQCATGSVRSSGGWWIPTYVNPKYSAGGELRSMRQVGGAARARNYNLGAHSTSIPIKLIKRRGLCRSLTANYRSARQLEGSDLIFRLWQRVSTSVE